MGFFDRFKKKPEKEPVPDSENIKTLDTAASDLSEAQRPKTDTENRDDSSEQQSEIQNQEETAAKTDAESGIKQPSPEEIYMETLTRCLGPARIRQLQFGELVVADKNWNVDFSEGVILFGFSSYPIQFLGSESYSSSSWLWGVENINGFPDHILALVNRFFHEKAARLAPSLHHTKVMLDESVNGHNIASIVTATSDEPVCYYRCPYEGGAAYVLVQNLPEAVFETPSPLTVSKALQDVISQTAVNHWILTKSTLESCCETVDVQAERITGTLPGKGTIQVEFDLLGRITRIHFDNR